MSSLYLAWSFTRRFRAFLRYLDTMPLRASTSAKRSSISIFSVYLEYSYMLRRTSSLSMTVSFSMLSILVSSCVTRSCVSSISLETSSNDPKVSNSESAESSSLTPPKPPPSATLPSKKSMRSFRMPPPPAELPAPIAAPAAPAATPVIRSEKILDKLSSPESYLASSSS